MGRRASATFLQAFMRAIRIPTLERKPGHGKAGTHKKALNKISEPFRKEQPEPSELDAQRFADENPDVLACLDPD